MNPDSLSPMTATTGALPRREAAWAYEVKWDGMRALATCRGGAVRLAARTGNDITVRYPELAEMGSTTLDGIEGTVDDPIVVDGEIVMFDAQGRPSFGDLQHRMHVSDPATARRLAAESSVVFVAFDLLWTPVGPCVDRTYDERRHLLEQLEFAGDRVLRPPIEVGEPDAFVEFCRDRGLEGVVAKRRDAPYRPGRRSDAWVKVKFRRRQEFVVIGWTEGNGVRSGQFAALMLGYYDDAGDLHYAGKAGAGFSDRELRSLAAELRGLARDEPAVVAPDQRRAVHWVDPVMVVEVAFVEWSPTGHLRHPAYLGRRTDVDPRSVRREPGS